MTFQCVLIVLPNCRRIPNCVRGRPHTRSTPVKREEISFFSAFAYNMTSCAVFLVIFCSAFIPMILKIKKITNWCYRNYLLFHSTWVHLGLWWDPCYYHVVYCHYFTSVVCKLFTFYSSSIETNGLIRSRLGRDDHWMVFYNVIFCSMKFTTETIYSKIPKRLLSVFVCGAFSSNFDDFFSLCFLWNFLYMYSNKLCTDLRYKRVEMGPTLILKKNLKSELDRIFSSFQNETSKSRGPTQKMF